jgi:DnaJ-class molecular chaperone
MDMGFKWTCRPCRGYGYYGNDPKDTCEVCIGRGSIFINDERDEFQTCVPCRGYGYYGNNSKDTCQVCGGFGIVKKIYADPE